MRSGSIKNVTFVGNHIPRQCGIATFTSDLCSAVSSLGIDTQVVAVTDPGHTYSYPDNVSIEIVEDDLASYREAARKINDHQPDVISVQHEYGIYGGKAGAHLLALLREVNAPIVTTLHTIVQSPTAEQLEVMSELSQLSERLVVMTQRGKSLLREVHGIDPGKVCVVAHGIPEIERVPVEPCLDKLGLSGKKLILTFGLLSPDKGIQHMIGAMPAIVAQHPDAYYLVVGATHPNVRSHSGEVYRDGLADLAVKLGVGDHVGFVDRFVSLDHLKDFLQASSIYVTPYLNREQITSGTLAYAFGVGKAVVSTPYWHAEELLADGRGILVPFRDSDALARAISGLLGNPVHLENIQSKAFECGSRMSWPIIGEEYLDVFEAARESTRLALPELNASAVRQLPEAENSGKLNLTHLLDITDETGIIQHATYCVPNRVEGYCTDDNARLGIVGVLLDQTGYDSKTAGRLQHIALSFMQHAFNPSNGRMRNFLTYSRHWAEDAGSDDSHARALWALGTLADESSLVGVSVVARTQFLKALPAAKSFKGPRPCAFTILGLNKVLSSSYSEDCLAMIELLGDRLNALYIRHSKEDWRWFEPILAYDNARLPQALMTAGYLLSNEEMISNGTEALNWLLNIQTDDLGYFLPIGSNGFYKRGGYRAVYDQQPVEAAATVGACFEAFMLTSEPEWQTRALKTLEWFHGGNYEQSSLIDPLTGGCKDGLMDGSVNQNQGAESMLSYLMASLQCTQMNAAIAKRQKGFLG